MADYKSHLQTLCTRFDEALQATGFDSVLIYSGHPYVAFLDDNPYAFRPNPFFKYWVPLIKSPKSFIYYKPGQKPKVYLFQARDFWHSTPVLPLGDWQEETDITLIDSLTQIRASLGEALKSVAFIGELQEPVDGWQVRAQNPKKLIDYLQYQRAEKTDYEIACMRKANEIAVRGHNAARDAFYEGRSELDINMAYLSAMRFRESEVPYNSIVALNEHSAVLHYDVYDTVAPSEHRSFLIDAGATYNGYCADITRSYAKEKSGFYAELVEVMDKAEQDIIAEIEVGKSYYDLHVSMHRKIAGILKDFGFFKTDADKIYERGYTNAFFPHGLGHYIGLQVHDVGGFLKNPNGDEFARDARHPFLRLLRDIKPGQVFTIEPGLYVVDQLLEEFEGNEDFNWARVAELRPYGGVRIEDSVLVTENGVENLTRNAFDSLK